MDQVGVICRIVPQNGRKDQQPVVCVLLASEQYQVENLSPEQAAEQLQILGDTELQYKYGGESKLERDFERGVFEDAINQARELAGLAPLGEDEENFAELEF